MNDLIDSNGSEAKLLIMRQAIKWYAYCVDSKTHVITEPKTN